MRDSFLNYTSAEMRTCTEDCISADLGYGFNAEEYDGKLSENIVKENFESFFKFYNTGIYNGIEIVDIVNKDDHAIAGFYQDEQYVIVSYNFKLKTLKYNNSIKERWDAINIACALYLELNPEIDNKKYILTK